jgi:hypothetical protein
MHQVFEFRKNEVNVGLAINIMVLALAEMTEQKVDNNK